jgi:hypothetical protein
MSIRSSLHYPVAAILLAATMPAASAQTCGDRVTFVRSVIDKDLKVGFIGKDVYAAMTKDLDSASAICRSGQDARAQLIISSTQSRHGYPVR